MAAKKRKMLKKRFLRLLAANPIVEFRFMNPHGLSLLSKFVA